MFRRVPSALKTALSGLLACALLAGAAAHAASDPRQFMHGIGTARAPDGAHYLFYSSSGLPPAGAGADGAWPHDIYVSTWQPASGVLSPPKIFISRPEAQEPVSVAQNQAGAIMLSFEDGFDTRDEVSQRYGLYGADLQPIKPYPQDILSGGHSGHVAAVGERFVVFYSEGWVQGGGVDNLGSGDNVRAAVLEADGRIARQLDVARGRRAWWPVLAASPDRALLVWQQFVRGRTDASLHAAILVPGTGKLLPLGRLLDRLRYYTYQVAWVPAANRFLLTGTRAGAQGFALLITPAGKVVGRADCLPATVREAEILVRERRALIPAAGGQVIQVDIDERDAMRVGTLPLGADWGSTGTLGLPAPDQRVAWFTLTPQGLRQIMQPASLAPGKPAPHQGCTLQAAPRTPS
jgi:hypothetical protein